MKSEATFDELWEFSKSFSLLFVGEKGPFPFYKNFSRKAAVNLWKARYPKIKWGFCKHEDCYGLVQRGEFCHEHWESSGKLPTWKWHGGILYRYMSLIEDRKYKPGSRVYEYRDYLKVVAEKRFHKISRGYNIIQMDGNPFNLSASNIVLLSDVGLVLFEKKMLTLNEALEMDELIGDFVERRAKGGKKPFCVTFGYSDIAQAAGTIPSTVRTSVARGKLDPRDLRSIVQFVNLAKKGNN